MRGSPAVFDEVDLFVAPSPSIAAEFQRLGIERIEDPDLGLRVRPVWRSQAHRNGTSRSRGPLRIGYVGTLVWHKGVHVLLDAVRASPMPVLTS